MIFKLLMHNNICKNKLQRYESFLNRAKKKFIFFSEVLKLADNTILQNYPSMYYYIYRYNNKRLKIRCLQSVSNTTVIIG